MNRKHRRAAQKTTPRWMPPSRDERIKALVKNGITVKDLEDNYKKGYDAGFADASPATFKTIFAAICLALNDLHGFGRKRCLDILQAVDGHVLNSLTSTESIEAVYERMGLEIDFGDPLDRIWLKEDA